MLVGQRSERRDVNSCLRLNPLQLGMRRSTRGCALAQRFPQGWCWCHEKDSAPAKDADGRNSMCF